MPVREIEQPGPHGVARASTIDSQGVDGSHLGVLGVFSQPEHVLIRLPQRGVRSPPSLALDMAGRTVATSGRRRHLLGQNWGRGLDRLVHVANLRNARGGRRVARSIWELSGNSLGMRTERRVRSASRE